MAIIMTKTISLNMPAGAGWLLAILVGIAIFMLVKWVWDILP